MDFCTIRNNIGPAIRSIDRINRGQMVFYRRGNDLVVGRFEETEESGWLRNHIAIFNTYSRSDGAYWASCRLTDPSTDLTYSIELSRFAFEQPWQFSQASIYEISQGAIDVLTTQLDLQATQFNRLADILRSAL